MKFQSQLANFQQISNFFHFFFQRASQRRPGSEPSNNINMSATINPKAFPLANAQLTQQILDLVQQGTSLP
jgi:hypothetical protein